MAELQLDEKLIAAAMGVPKKATRGFRLHSRVLPRQQELEIVGDECNAAGPIVFDCMVCLCEVAPEDDVSRKLPNCDHGVQFHDVCIESWLKDHPTCPLCRSHVPRPVLIRLKTCLVELVDDMVSYCNHALENVATSIGDYDSS